MIWYQANPVGVELFNALSVFPINCIHTRNVSENTEKQKLLRFPHRPRGSICKTCQVLLHHRG